MNIIVELEYKDSDYPILAKNQEDLYNKYYQKKGWIYSKKYEMIYYIVEMDIIPLEGQRLLTKNGICIVEYSILNIEQNEETNLLDMSRIVITSE